MKVILRDGVKTGMRKGGDHARGRRQGFSLHTVTRGQHVFVKEEVKSNG